MVARLRQPGTCSQVQTGMTVSVPGLPPEAPCLPLALICIPDQSLKPRDQELVTDLTPGPAPPVSCRHPTQAHGGRGRKTCQKKLEDEQLDAEKAEDVHQKRLGEALTQQPVLHSCLREANSFEAAQNSPANHR